MLGQIDRHPPLTALDLAQSSFGDADGKVGPNTFGYADSKLRCLSGSTASGGNLKLRYQGARYCFDAYRTDGKYRIHPNDAWHSTSCTSNTCD